MSTIPTQNPVPSEAAKDLKFNSGKIDEFVTSMKNKYIDRFGQEHFTIEGLRWVAQQAISQFGYITLDSFQKGAEITLPNQVLRDEVTGEYYRWDGALPKLVQIDSTPDSSGGIGIGKWLSVGDASLRKNLDDGTATIYGEKSRNLVETIEGNKNNLEKLTKLMVKNPSLPASSNTTKLIMRSSGESGFNIISKKSRNRSGYIRTTVRPDATKEDDYNLGGKSNWRPHVVTNISKCYVGNTVKTNSYGGVSQPILAENITYGFLGIDRSGSNGNYYSEVFDCSENSLKTPKIYAVEKDSYIEFLSNGDSSVRFGVKGDSSDDVLIDIIAGGVTYNIGKFSTKSNLTNEPISHIDIDIKNRFVRNADYTIRITNKSDNIAYIAGCNIKELSECTENTYITNSIAYISSNNRFYRESNGANEFAARVKGGKYFGTFHGGHEPIIERLRLKDFGNYDLNNRESIPNLMLSDFVSVYSLTKLTIPNHCTYNFTSTWDFYDGIELCRYGILLDSGNEPTFDMCYTHMCASSVDFFSVLYPSYLSTASDNDYILGEHGECYQQGSRLSIRSYYSELFLKNERGLFVRKNNSFSKQYYALAYENEIESIQGNFVTCKEFF